MEGGERRADTAAQIVRSLAKINPLEEHGFCAICAPLSKETWDLGLRHNPDCPWWRAVVWVDNDGYRAEDISVDESQWHGTPFARGPGQDREV